jgi:transcriptional regulator with XRE-family HTH domain
MLNPMDTHATRTPHPWRRHLDSDLASALVLARHRARLSQQSVARAAGISRSYLSRLEGGTRVPRSATVVRLDRVLNLDDEVVERLLELAHTFVP